MAINPMKLLQYKGMWEQFIANHPKLPKFFEVVSKEALETGTVIEISVTTAEGKNYVSNIRLTESDMEFIRKVKEESGNF